MDTINKCQFPAIIIVEDDEDDIFILKEGFDDIAYWSVRFYSFASSAISYLEQIADEALPKLIVTDFNLPGINGFEFVRFLKKHPRFSVIPLVVLTTSMSYLNQQLFAAEGVTKVIIKPGKFFEYKSVAKDLKSLAEQAPET